MKRKKNLIIHEVAESESTDTSDGHSDGIGVVGPFFEAIYFNYSKIKYCTRLGNKVEPSEGVP